MTMWCSQSTPSPTPTPTFEQQRAKVVQFLKQMNQASNNFDDTFMTSGFEEKYGSGDFSQMDAALSTILSQIEGFSTSG